MQQFAVIVAGGSGTRMGGGLPKQFRPLCGRPVLWWSMKAFKDENPETEIILVLPHDFISLWKEIIDSLPEEERFRHLIAEGGKIRSDSVKNGLDLINNNESLVAIHDGARPLVNKKIISDGWINAKNNGAAIPVIPVTDSLRKVEKDKKSHSVDRNGFVAVQTPQVFKTSLLKGAFNLTEDNSFTDEASLVESVGNEVVMFEGSNENLKITNPKDLEIATVLMGGNV